LPFVTKEYVDLFKEQGDLVVRIGSFKRHVFLPKLLTHRQPGRATLDSNVLAINFPKPIEAGEER
jgi:arsenite/tail-anchored protein-transporting ATPase